MLLTLCQGCCVGCWFDLGLGSVLVFFSFPHPPPLCHKPVSFPVTETWAPHARQRTGWEHTSLNKRLHSSRLLLAVCCEPSNACRIAECMQNVKRQGECETQGGPHSLLLAVRQTPAGSGMEGHFYLHRLLAGVPPSILLSPLLPGLTV